MTNNIDYLNYSIDELRNELSKLIINKNQITEKYNSICKQITFNGFSDWVIDSISNNYINIISKTNKLEKFKTVKIKFINDYDDFIFQICSFYSDEFDITDNESENRKYFEFIGYLCSNNENIIKLKQCVNSLYNDIMQLTDTILNIMSLINVKEYKERQRQIKMIRDNIVDAMINANENDYVIITKDKQDKHFIYRKQNVYVETLPKTYDETMSEFINNYADKYFNYKVIQAKKIKVCID